MSTLAHKRARNEGSVFWLGKKPCKQELGISSECGVCYKTVKDARMLPCCHLFCLECIKKYRNETRDWGPYGFDFKCRLCSKEVQIPDGGIDKFPSGQFIVKLVEVRQLKGRRYNRKKCTECQLIGGKEKASRFCCYCRIYLCESCLKKHQVPNVPESHKMVDVMPPESNELPKTGDSFCQDHPDEKITFYCNDCKTVSCGECKIIQHKEHDCSDIESLTCSIRKDLNGDCKKLKQAIVDKQDALKRMVEAKKKTDELFKNTEERIKDRYEYLKDLLKDHYESLKEDLSLWKYRRENELTELKNDVQIELDSTKRLDKFWTELKKHGSGVDIIEGSGSIKDTAKGLLELHTHQQDRSIRETSAKYYKVKFEIDPSSHPNFRSSFGKMKCVADGYIVAKDEYHTGSGPENEMEKDEDTDTGDELAKEKQAELIKDKETKLLQAHLLDKIAKLYPQRDKRPVLPKDNQVDTINLSSDYSDSDDMYFDSSDDINFDDSDSDDMDSYDSEDFHDDIDRWLTGRNLKRRAHKRRKNNNGRGVVARGKTKQSSLNRSANASMGSRSFTSGASVKAQSFTVTSAGGKPQTATSSFATGIPQTSSTSFATGKFQPISTASSTIGKPNPASTACGKIQPPITSSASGKPQSTTTLFAGGKSLPATISLALVQPQPCTTSFASGKPHLAVTSLTLAKSQSATASISSGKSRRTAFLFESEKLQLTASSFASGKPQSTIPSVASVRFQPATTSIPTGGKPQPAIISLAPGKPQPVAISFPSGKPQPAANPCVAGKPQPATVSFFKVKSQPAVATFEKTQPAVLSFFNGKPQQAITLNASGKTQPAVTLLGKNQPAVPSFAFRNPVPTTASFVIGKSQPVDTLLRNTQPVVPSIVIGNPQPTAASFISGKPQPATASAASGKSQPTAASFLNVKTQPAIPSAASGEPQTLQGTGTRVLGTGTEAQLVWYYDSLTGKMFACAGQAPMKENTKPDDLPTVVIEHNNL